MHQIAGIEPRFEILNGQDPVAYILSSNVTRRHMTKGRRGMAVAKALLLSNNGTQGSTARSVGVSQSRVSHARVFLEYAAEVADEVLAGTTVLNEAYKTARERKAQQTSQEAEAEHAARNLAALKMHAPSCSSPRPQRPPTADGVLLSCGELAGFELCDEPRPTRRVFDLLLLRTLATQRVATAESGGLRGLVVRATTLRNFCRSCGRSSLKIGRAWRAFAIAS
jgi:hypothetical protein